MIELFTLSISSRGLILVSQKTSCELPQQLEREGQQFERGASVSVDPGGVNYCEILHRLEMRTSASEDAGS